MDRKVFRNSGGPPVEYDKDGKPLPADGQFEVGDQVEKWGGDYRFSGVVVAKFRKMDGDQLRYVVQNEDGLLHIFSGHQLTEPMSDEKLTAELKKTPEPEYKTIAGLPGKHSTYPDGICWECYKLPGKCRHHLLLEEVERRGL